MLSSLRFMRTEWVFCNWFSCNSLERVTSAYPNSSRKWFSKSSGSEDRRRSGWAEAQTREREADCRKDLREEDCIGVRTPFDALRNNNTRFLVLGFRGAGKWARGESGGWHERPALQGR